MTQEIKETKDIKKHKKRHNKNSPIPHAKRTKNLKNKIWPQRWNNGITNTFEELGKALGKEFDVTHKRIRQIKTKALEKVKQQNNQ